METLEELLRKYNEDTSSSSLNEMSNQLDHLSSVCYIKDAGTLCGTDIFSEAFIELEKACPVLSQCLYCAIGNKIDTVSKVATISTTYGMVLHCRNVKVSCIQRL